MSSEKMRNEKTYYVSDQGTQDEPVVAGSVAEAARRFAHGFQAATDESRVTYFCMCRVSEERESEDYESFTIPVHPRVVCTRDDTGEMWDKHDWVQDGEAWGHGGGVRYDEVCTQCRMTRHVNTWDQAPDGSEGYTTFRLEDWSD